MLTSIATSEFRMKTFMTSYEMCHALQLIAMLQMELKEMTVT